MWIFSDRNTRTMYGISPMYNVYIQVCVRARTRETFFVYVFGWGPGWSQKKKTGPVFYCTAAS